MIFKKTLIIILSLISFNSFSSIDIKIEKKEKNISFYIESNSEDISSKIVSNFEKIKNISGNKKIENKNYKFFINKKENNYTVKLENSKKSFLESYNFDNKIKATNFLSNRIHKFITGKESFFNERLVFVKESKDKYELVQSDFKGEDLSKIIVSPEPILSPDISDNNEFVVYVSFENIRPTIYIHYLKNNKRKSIANFKGVNAYPKISPDNKKVLISVSKNGNADLYVFEIEKNTLKQITKERGDEISPEWIDNERILFASNKKGNPKIYELNLKTNKVKKYFNSNTYMLSPTFNERFTLSIFKDKGFYGLYRKNNNNDKEDKILRDFYIESPSITKNGDIIVYATKENGLNLLNFIDKDGNKMYSIKYQKSNIIEPSF